MKKHKCITTFINGSTKVKRDRNTQENNDWTLVKENEKLDLYTQETQWISHGINTKRFVPRDTIVKMLWVTRERQLIM
jgi:hypothetical protein